ncbi:MAG: hypothetical protein WC866_06270 [Patescibacteria group bacterium]|jgi:hypothetical protein
MKVIIPGKHDYAWKKAVTCGRHAGGGCGATLEIGYDDLFVEKVPVDDGATAEKVLCFCPSCGDTVLADDPSGFRTLPNRQEWMTEHPHALEKVREAARRYDEALGIKRGISIY